jgi:hypothetical protein
VSAAAENVFTSFGKPAKYKQCQPPCRGKAEPQCMYYGAKCTDCQAATIEASSAFPLQLCRIPRQQVTINLGESHFSGMPW